MLAGAHDLTVLLPVLACTGPRIENHNLVICELVCIGACIGLYWSVLDCIASQFVLVNVFGSVLAQIEMKACIWSVFAQVIISYIPNTNSIHANT